LRRYFLICDASHREVELSDCAFGLSNLRYFPIFNCPTLLALQAFIPLRVPPFFVGLPRSRAARFSGVRVPFWRIPGSGRVFCRR
jgi:hypothetical protein